MPSARAPQPAAGDEGDGAAKGLGHEDREDHRQRHAGHGEAIRPDAWRRRQVADQEREDARRRPADHLDQRADHDPAGAPIEDRRLGRQRAEREGAGHRDHRQKRGMTRRLGEARHCVGARGPEIRADGADHRAGGVRDGERPPLVEDRTGMAEAEAHHVADLQRRVFGRRQVAMQVVHGGDDAPVAQGLGRGPTPPCSIPGHGARPPARSEQTPREAARITAGEPCVNGSLSIPSAFSSGLMARWRRDSLTFDMQNVGLPAGRLRHPGARRHSTATARTPDHDPSPGLPWQSSPPPASAPPDPGPALQEPGAGLPPAGATSIVSGRKASVISPARAGPGRDAA